MPGPYSIVSEIPPKGDEDASAPWGVPPADRRPRQSTGRRPEPSRHIFLEQDVRIVLSQEISMENAPSRRNFLAAGLALPLPRRHPVPREPDNRRPNRLSGRLPARRCSTGFLERPACESPPWAMAA